MNKEEILVVLTNVLVDNLVIVSSEVKLTSNLRDDLGCDSLDALEISEDIQSEFNLHITDEQLGNLIDIDTTVSDLVDSIAKLIQ